MSRYAGTKQRGSGWSYYIYVDGKKKWVSGFSTQREAWHAKTEAEIRKRRGSLVDKSKTSFRDVVADAWLPSVESRLKPTTVSQYKEKIRYALKAFGDRPVQDIRPSDIEKLRNDLLARGLSPRTVSLALVTTSLAFKYARDIDGLVYDNPCDRVKKPRIEQSNPHVLSGEELHQIEELAKGGQWEAFVRLAIYTGARRGELLALRWADVDLDKGHVRFSRNAVVVDGKRVEQSTKSGKARVVTIDAETVAILRRRKSSQAADRLKYGQYWHDTDLVVSNQDGSAPQPRSATQAWDRLVRKAGIVGFRLHDARHAHATHLLAVGVPLHVVAARLGHKDAMVTATVYSHVLESQAVGAADDFVRAIAVAR